ncbi:septal ring lytic transglycosylase RlpA family protein [Kordiimonas aquimaris]|uniref:septal ring lytic transglycosylase RlpA family protein n=1 Tax=Kordiimonas aquimaris TaxID=707591 RepID=UPI0021D319A4|nr:septal ring lytic transglycosylase RlpA family protein [Kordiimonas aquimaris]
MIAISKDMKPAKAKLTQVLILGFIAVALVACSSSAPTRTVGRMPRNDEMPKGDQGVKRKVGNPYKVAGVWYHPKEDPTYDQVGFASWYGRDFHGKKTANGEIYNMNALTAAHKTLPMPTYVKVTNLENNRSIVLRVNDRGPFVAGRLIDVSRRGAQLLGFEKQGVTRVRIQASDEQGRVASRRSTSHQVSAAPSRSSRQSPQTASEDMHFVQIGSYSSRQNADVQISALRRAGHRAESSRQVSGSQTFWRVRVGPFQERNLAEDKLDQIVADGFYEARIFTEQNR